MTTTDTRYLSKAELRKEVARLRLQIENKEAEVESERHRAEFVARLLDRTREEHSASYAALKDLGFEPILDLVPIEANGSRQLTGWRPPARFVALTQDELEQREETTVRRVRQEALQTVIEALGLKEYQRKQMGLRASHAAGQNGRPVYRDGITFSTEPVDTDRLWSDLQTALDVRAERKAQADREATEKRVSALAEHPTAQQIAGSLVDQIGSLFAGPITPCIDENCACKNVKTEEARPEKDPQGLTGRIDGKKPKKEKAA